MILQELNNPPGRVIQDLESLLKIMQIPENMVKIQVALSELRKEGRIAFDEYKGESFVTRFTNMRLATPSSITDYYAFQSKQQQDWILCEVSRHEVIPTLTETIKRSPLSRSPLEHWVGAANMLRTRGLITFGWTQSKAAEDVIEIVDIKGTPQGRALGASLCPEEAFFFEQNTKF